MLSPCATWYQNGITFFNSSGNGSGPLGLFVNVNDSVYVAISDQGQALMWLNGSIAPSRTFNTSSSTPNDVFVASNGDVYLDNGAAQQRVDRWALNTTTPSTGMYVNGACYGVFVDIRENLYCSLGFIQRVIRRSLNGPINSTSVVAGDGTLGNAANQLNSPRGIFVDTNLTLYVADFNNHRVQSFSYGRSNGTTVAGSTAPGTITLNGPSDVILDANGYLFIADYLHHRIVASGPNGFRCMAGCTGTPGTASNRLNHPHSISFDSSANLFVADASNQRIQKFMLATNFCGAYIDLL